ncbi:O-acetyl-ADP-ribose deacetylase [Dyella silvatica]|uniref:O-acetyl-ADP-ribose deacetylase n=1 Tax=Dyella silvatica TaxID=2992128 RepID=UPI00224FB4BB|nr:O-acetyl-ADP-ribose deacetylase [Dyella silvatica]
MPLEIITGDITRLAVDAIVNAANPSLLGGGGVDAAIHRAAGPALLKACRALPEVAIGVRCPTGEARLTAGFGLPADWVIHTVGPIWRGGEHDEAMLLARCYRHCIELALAHGIRSMAFPAISCGVYGYPPERAASVALNYLLDARRHGLDMQLQICCFDAAMTAVWHAQRRLIESL